MYTKTSWVARVGTALNRFLKSNESSGSVELTADPTGVSTAGTPFTADNMNKIEQGIYDAHVGLDNNGLIDNTRINQDVRTTANPTFANSTIAGHNIDSELDTLNGRVNQGVKTTDSPTFASINTGHGANELYAMNQNVRTTDQVTFATVNTGQGATEVHLMNQNLRTTDSPTFAKLKLTTSTYGSQSIGKLGTWVVPVGIYIFPYTKRTSIEIWDGSSWVVNGESSTEFMQGVIISDGSNIRIKNTLDSIITIHYRKFS